MPRNLSVEQLASEWRQVCESYPLEVREEVLATVMKSREELVTFFYDQMLLNPASAFFLKNDVVSTRLHQAMQQWLKDVFELGTNGAFEAAVTRQRQVGEAHARINIPDHMVLRGLRYLDAAIYALYAARVPAATIDVAAYISQMTSIAVEIMCNTYSVSHDKNARADESYRVFAMAQDIGAEKDRQRAAVLDWENHLIYEISMRFSQSLSVVPTADGKSSAPPTLSHACPFPLLRASEFGLWFLHKAADIFEGDPDIVAISLLIEEIDHLLQRDPIACQLSSAHLAGLIVDVREKTKLLGFLLDQMFQQAGHVESGRDTLTQLLSRKYLQVIMTRQIDHARRHDEPLAILTVDIDHFKRINDTYGHDAGDVALQQIAHRLKRQFRGGDYIFRLGGEEFLVILVETDIDQAMMIAEDLRHKIAVEPLQLPNGSTLHATVSIGVVGHDGHPDYDRLLKHSDLALYEAKQTGRNRVVGYRNRGADSDFFGAKA